jgi:hypothetical protein
MQMTRLWKNSFEKLVSFTPGVATANHNINAITSQESSTPPFQLNLLVACASIAAGCNTGTNAHHTDS